MSFKYLNLVFRNLIRSKTRMIVTTAGCAIAAFIMCFFLASARSFDNMMSSAANSSNLVITQKDRY